MKGHFVPSGEDELLRDSHHPRSGLSHSLNTSCALFAGGKDVSPLLMSTFDMSYTSGLTGWEQRARKKETGDFFHLRCHMVAFCLIFGTSFSNSHKLVFWLPWQRVSAIITQKFIRWSEGHCTSSHQIWSNLTSRFPVMLRTCKQTNKVNWTQYPVLPLRGRVELKK